MIAGLRDKEERGSSKEKIQDGRRKEQNTSPSLLYDKTTWKYLDNRNGLRINTELAGEELVTGHDHLYLLQCLCVLLRAGTVVGTLAFAET